MQMAAAEVLPLYFVASLTGKVSRKEDDRRSLPYSCKSHRPRPFLP